MVKVKIRFETKENRFVVEIGQGITVKEAFINAFDQLFGEYPILYSGDKIVVVEGIE